MTDQTRTGTYGSWYSYYVCGFSGRITLPPGSATLPGVKQLMDQLNHLDFHSTAPRCNGATAPMSRTSQRRPGPPARSDHPRGDAR